MIRLLGEEDREPALAVLDRDHELNLIMIYDIEHFGIEDRGIAVTEVGGEIVSKAEVMVRTSRAALIGGVHTVPEHRGNGHSFSSMSLLCRGILDATGKACLSVARKNAPAQRVYRGIGFEKLCDYRMAHFAHQGPTR